VGLGDATFIRAFTVNPDSAFDHAQQAIAALRRAVALDTGLAAGYAGLGYTLSFANWEWTKADSMFKRAIALDPSYAPARYWYMQLLALTGSKDAALAEGREALRLDPLSAVASFNYGIVAVASGKHDEGLAALERASELQPTYRFPYWPMAIEYARRAQREKAEATLRTYLAQAANGQGVDTTLVRDVVGALIGHRDTSRSIVRLLATGVLPGESAAAWAFAAVGERDSAFARLDKAIAMHSVQITVGLGNSEPFLRGDPRWAALIKRVGLAR
jgi:tetratricopeptide (TPR) repeat protein